MEKNNPNNSSPLNDPASWKSLGFFSAEDYLIYIFKKTEKITAALYLVSGLLKDDEPMKWEIRDRGMDLLTSSFTASSSIPGDKNMVIQTLFTAALETISLLNVAKISNLVSEMNHTLLVREIDNIVGMLRDRLAQNAENAGYILSEAFFKTPDLFSTGFKMADRNIHSPISHGAGMKHGTQPQTNQGTTRSTQGHSDNMEGSDEKKLKRQGNIIALLKGQSGLTIKDFSRVIKDCSEKTIQRELLELIGKGLVTKEGERRWSKYSLKSS